MLHVDLRRQASSCVLVLSVASAKRCPGPLDAGAADALADGNVFGVFGARAVGACCWRWPLCVAKPRVPYDNRSCYFHGKLVSVCSKPHSRQSHRSLALHIHGSCCGNHHQPWHPPNDA